MTEKRTNGTHSDVVGRVLVVHVVADRCPFKEAAAPIWVAEICDAGSPLCGLFSWGLTLSEARSGLARTAWAALCDGTLGVKPDEVDAIRLLTTTRKTYRAAQLAAETAAGA